MHKNLVESTIKNFFKPKALGGGLEEGAQRAPSSIKTSFKTI